MGKQYEGNVEIYTNDTTKKVNIKPNPDGFFNKENVDKLYKVMKLVADKNGYKPNIYVPDASKAEVPVILQRFGKPYLAMLDKRDTSTSSKSSPIKVINPKDYL